MGCICTFVIINKIGILHNIDRAPLFTESVSHNIPLAVTGNDHLLIFAFFNDFDNGKASVLLHIGFGAHCMHFNNLPNGMQGPAAGIHGFDDHFVSIHI